MGFQRILFALLIIVGLFGVTYSFLHISGKVRFGPPLNSCNGAPDGTSCSLASSTTFIAGDVALAGGSTGVCKGGECVSGPPKNFTCSAGTFECSASKGKLCCPGSSGKKYKCVTTNDEPYCQPISNTSCQDLGSGWSLCNRGNGGGSTTSICCPSGTTCTNLYGEFSVCTTKTKTGCAIGTSECAEFCCTASQECLPLKTPWFLPGTVKVCSPLSDGCGAGKEWCPSQEPAPRPGENRNYPNLCCPTGTCAHVGQSGRPYCTDGSPGL